MTMVLPVQPVPKTLIAAVELRALQWVSVVAFLPSDAFNVFCLSFFSSSFVTNCVFHSNRCCNGNETASLSLIRFLLFEANDAFDTFDEVRVKNSSSFFSFIIYHVEPKRG